MDDIEKAIAALAKPKKPKLRAVKPGHVEDARATVYYLPENLSAHVAAVEGVLATTGDVYSRGGVLVRVAGVEEPRVIPFTAATLRARLSAAVVVVEKGQAGRIPDDLTKAVLESRTWPVPELVSILETPFMRPDGSVCSAAGFDRTTGYYLAPGLSVDVPETPTQDDAKAALVELEEVFADFPHVSRAHRMVPIAAILTLLARPAIRGSVPGFLFDASTRGSGKSLQTDAVSVIATGRTSAKMSWPSLPEELEKVLGAYALRGANIVNFDNVSSGFGGAALDRCLTAVDTVELRILGRTELPCVPWRGVIMASGNNLAVFGDTTRRVLVCRSESPLENPEERQDFRHPNLLPWVLEHRTRLVRAALVILRAYDAASRPHVGVRPWGSFEAWAAMVPGAIMYAGGADVSVCRAEQSSAPDPEKLALLAVLTHWGRLGACTAKRAISTLYTLERVRGQYCAPDGYDDLRDAIDGVTNARPGTIPSSKSLGKFLASARGRVVDGRRIEGTPDRKGVIIWTVENAGFAGLLPGLTNDQTRQELNKDSNMLDTSAGFAGLKSEMSCSRAHPPATSERPETTRQNPAYPADSDDAPHHEHAFSDLLEDEP